MKNKIFNVWIKELCSLIFVQSMQAMLMAIMLAVVVRLYVGSGENVSAKQSMGVYSIFVLAMIPKVELLVKKIFGLGSGVMNDSMQAGKNSLLKTGLAVRMGMHGLNNAGKAVGGLVGLGSSFFGTDAKKARIAKNNMDAANAEKERAKLMNENPQLINSQNNKTNTTSRITSSRSGNYNLDDLTAAIKNANASNPDDEYEKAKHELNQKRLNSLKQLTSGVTETVGYVGGAALGGVVSLGTGADDLLSDMAIAAGAGDKVGKAVTEVPFNTAAAIEDMSYNRRVINKKLEKSENQRADSIKAKEEYKAAVEQIKASAKKPTNKVHTQPSSADIKEIAKAKATTTSTTKRTIKVPTANSTPKAYTSDGPIKTPTPKVSSSQVKKAINDTKKTMGATTKKRTISGYKPTTKTGSNNINNIDNI